ncbi:hypothetical protein [Labilithrix luteola]|uniref:hypothetical protein n=1 Tax=Labilithrix luteola TaxID=1391654 RepID=UPI0011BA6457|nr:hypothetical protein [Labilithrix luteola]
MAFAMGKWMSAFGPDDKLTKDEVWPSPLLSAFHALPLSRQHEFPFLARLRFGSPDYVNEALVLEGPAVACTLTELRRLRRICRGEDVVAGIDGRVVFDSWRVRDAFGEQYDPIEMDESLDDIEGVLSRAVEYGWSIKIDL